MFARFLGVEHVSGNMFVSVPKADAMFTKVSFQIRYMQYFKNIIQHNSIF